ncbi:hypothetical protein C5167_035767 [Papaver somniferum]|nr:hypothetical protein C5167_035767 [Papaver somniferum]
MHQPSDVQILVAMTTNIVARLLLDLKELSQVECQDVIFKQAWLTHIRRRAKADGVDEDIAEERLQSWMDRTVKYKKGSWILNQVT